MASLDARDGRTELEGKEASADSAPSSHVSYGVEEPGSGEGYSAGDGTRPGPTMMQKVKEKVSDYENHLKGKESTDKEDPHPELAYIPPGDGKGEGVADLQEGKQHGGAPTAALGNDVPAEVTRDYMSVKDKKSGGYKKHFSGEGADEPTVMERIKEKVAEAGNRMKGKKSSAVEDPHPELAYIPPQPEEEKPSFFSRVEHKFGGQDDAAAAPKGTGSSEVGTGYEEDSEETLNPTAVPKYDEGVKPQT